MDYRITDVRAQDGHLVVEVDHFNPDGTLWFAETYLWQGREGNKFLVAVDAQGRRLMDNGLPVPEVPSSTGGFVEELPPAREFKRTTEVHLSNEAILHTISSIHKRGQSTGRSKPQALGRIPHSDRDEQGVARLHAKFCSLVGREHKN